MEYFSTRNASHRVTAAQAITGGLAPDGGLYVPSELPRVGREELTALCTLDYRGRARKIIGRFLPEFSPEETAAIVEASYGPNFDAPETAPTRFVGERTGWLELWHGPTCAFKDMALQMLPRLLTASLRKTGETRGVCILVATSGDTGKAALEGFADVPGTKILVFYPRDGVSDVQRLQMVTQKGGNVRVCAVAGNFDDAQTGVKTIFGDAALAKTLDGRGWFLSSANSINWGRLLPQIVYYFSAYCDGVNAGLVKIGEKLNFCVPTGNFGNILAGWYAKQMGLPAGRFICASNSNNVLTDFIRTGVYDRNRRFYTTMSPSMDILVSSNLERLLYALSGSDGLTAGCMRDLRETGRYTVPDSLRDAVRADFSADFCTEAETAAEIARVWHAHGYLIDPHTAVAGAALEKYRAETGDAAPAVVVSTASPYKFCDSVLAALGRAAQAPGAALMARLSALTGTPVPEPLRELASRPVRFSDCAAQADMAGVVADFLR